MRNVVKTTATVAGLLVAVYWILHGWNVYQSPLTYGEMDFNHDGDVTYSEAAYASNFGTRIVVDHGRHCTEYFSYKSGHELKTVCRD